MQFTDNANFTKLPKRRSFAQGALVKTGLPDLWRTTGGLKNGPNLSGFRRIAAAVPALIHPVSRGGAVSSAEGFGRMEATPP